MATGTYTATGFNLKNYSTYWQENATQGVYSNTRRIGVICFPGLNLSGKTILDVKLKLTFSASGSNANKTIGIYRSGVQGSINTSVAASNYISTLAGTISGTYYNNTVSNIEANFLATALAAGENIFGIYRADSLTSGYSANYLKITNAVLTVTYSDTSEPPIIGTPTPPTITSHLYGTLTDYDIVGPVIAWTDGTAPAGFLRYDIQRALSTDHHLDNWDYSTTTTGTSYNTQLNPTYGLYARYRIRTVDKNGNVSSWVYTGNLRRMLPNTTPTNVTASLTGNTYTLSWDSDTAYFVYFDVQYVDIVAGSGVWTSITATQETGLYWSGTLPCSSRVKFRVRMRQDSVDSTNERVSNYAESNVITLPGGISIKNGGAWAKEAQWIKVNGVWKRAKKVFIKVAGTWKESK